MQPETFEWVVIILLVIILLGVFGPLGWRR